MEKLQRNPDTCLSGKNCEDFNDSGKMEEYVKMNERFKAVYGHFAETTTFGGLIHTYVSPHWIWRTVWGVVMLFLIGATAWNTVEVVMEYLTYPVVTSIQVAHQPSILFPTVTICNRNPVQCQKLAVAYIKHPEDLNNLMYYSNCAETVSKDPLLSKLMAVETSNPAFSAWRSDLENRTWVAIGKNLYAEEFKAGTFCKSVIDQKLRIATKPTFDELIPVLTEYEDCKADLRKFLFPTLSDPRDIKQTTEPAVISPTNVTPGIATNRSSTTITPATTTLKPPIEHDLGSSEAAERFITEFASIFKDRSKAYYLIKELADDLSEFIVDCSFFGKSCLNESEFLLDFAPDYGSCFTFNSVLKMNSSGDAEEDKEAHLTGGSYGLSLEIMLNQDNYLPQVAAAGAGVRVAITTPGVRPNPVDEGYYVAPNVEADFAFRLQQFSRQPDPYESHCWNEWSQTSYQPLFYDLEENETKEIEAYSYGECILLCSSYLLTQDCGCMEPRKQQPFLYKGEDITATYGICEASNETQKQCKTDVLGKIRSMEPGYTCDCNLPCEETLYIMTTSSAEWPCITFRPTILRKYWEQLKLVGGEKVEGNTSQAEEERQRLISQEFARINVYVQSLNVEEISEDPLYDTLGAVGGALGLYVGICGITLLEIGEFLILCIMTIGGYNHSKMVEDAEGAGNVDDDGKSVDEEPQRISHQSHFDDEQLAQHNRSHYSRSQMLLPDTGRLKVGPSKEDPTPHAVWKEDPGVFLPRSESYWDF